MSKATTALVIGGGVAGSVIALALRKAGIDATIYERYPVAADGVGAGLSLAPNGQQALRVIGADQALDSLGIDMPGSIFGDANGNIFTEFAGFPELPATRVMARADLFRALADYAAARGVHFEYGKRLVSVAETAEAVTATFADGSTATADILIGADGIRSTVRTLIDADAPGPEYGGVLSFGGIARGSDVETKDGMMYFAFGRTFLGYYRVPAGAALGVGRGGHDDPDPANTDANIVWFASLPRTEPLTSSETGKISNAEWLTQLGELYTGHVPGETLLAHTAPEDLTVVGPMELMPSVPTWHRGRIVLVGDSAHAPSSSSGQGASLAIESAIELARCLRDLPVADAFTAYEQLRRPRVEAIADGARGANKAKAEGKPTGRPALPDPEEMFRHTHCHTIDWDQAVTPA
ncbi:MAG: monooxygenase [Nocardia sp.]|uniref:FAD-dependent oxidoreductase n=1 Tax=Nocardia sp. TaxID=1821 RepID=UPI002602EE9C|nr:NAD(P)/FAD-dependent oxidoreductase [Nocardia sp.]MCU1641430.1 monooxygenase [Nocardia sp.]